MARKRRHFLAPRNHAEPSRTKYAGPYWQKAAETDSGDSDRFEELYRLLNRSEETIEELNLDVGICMTAALVGAESGLLNDDDDDEEMTQLNRIVKRQGRWHSWK